MKHPLKTLLACMAIVLFLGACNARVDTDQERKQILQKAFLERNLQPSNLQIHVNGDSAWAVFNWTFAGKLANGQPFTSKGWESHVYQKTGAGWRIEHLHYSEQPPRS